MLRRAHEHLHQIIVHAIVQVALEGPRKLRVLDIAGVNGGVIGVQAQRAVLELDHQLKDAVVFAGGEIQQGMIVAVDFRLHFLEWRHGLMLA